MNLAEMYTAYEQDRETVTLPAGRYELEVVAAPVKPVANGDGRIVPLCRVLDGEQAGRRAWVGSFPLTEQSRDRFWSEMRSLGLTFEDVAGLERLEDVARLLVGRRFTADVEQTERHGRTFNEVKRIHTTGQDFPRGRTAAEIRGLERHEQ